MTVMRSRETDREPQARRPEGILARTLATLGRVLRLLLLSLLVSIVVEWAGMQWWWPEQGTQHSRAMLEAEIDYLDSNVGESLVSQDPAGLARQFANTAYESLFVRTGMINAMRWLSKPPADAGRTRRDASRAYRAIESHIEAAINIVQVFGARLAVLCLASPLFLLVSMLGIVDGLVQRDLRRWGGGRESSYLYHYAKRSNGVFLVSAWVLYLALPFSVPPVWIILPFATLLGLSLSITASMFKKYL